MPGSVCVEPFGPRNIVSEGGLSGNGGTNLPECAFADDLEKPEVKESDLAVKIDGLRATANSPHGVVRGEEMTRAVVRNGSLPF